MPPDKNIQREVEHQCITYCSKMLSHLDSTMLHSIFTLDTCILNCSKFQEQKWERKKTIEKKNAQ